MSNLFSDINLAVHEVEGDMLKMREDGWRKTDALEKAQTVIIKLSKEVGSSKLNLKEYWLAKDSLHLRWLDPPPAEWTSVVQIAYSCHDYIWDAIRGTHHTEWEANWALEGQGRGNQEGSQETYGWDRYLKALWERIHQVKIELWETLWHSSERRSPETSLRSNDNSAQGTTCLSPRTTFSSD